MSALIELDLVSKHFFIPSVRRETVREHMLGVLDPRRFRKLQVLDGISLALSAGEALGIMGRNGCGKSTLLKLVCGIYQPDGGRVTIRAAITPILELGVGWNPELDAIDNVCLIGGVMGMSLADIRRRMDAILAFAELAPFANLKLKHYSSGMASRLGYAVAFEAVREVLVLDEILAVGDAGFKAKCEQRYLELRARGHAVMFVTHSVPLMTAFCDRALLLDAGRIMLEGSPATIAAEYVHSLTSGAGQAFVTPGV